MLRTGREGHSGLSPAKTLGVSDQVAYVLLNRRLGDTAQLLIICRAQRSVFGQDLDVQT